MVQEASMDDFDKQLMERVETQARDRTQPRSFYNNDGDCIELLFSEEGYRAERLDDLITVYYGRESGNPAGALIKGVKAFIREVVELQPGSRVDFTGGSVKIEYILTAGLWSHGNEERDIIEVYLCLRKVADSHNLVVELGELEFA